MEDFKEIYDGVLAEWRKTSEDVETIWGHSYGKLYWIGYNRVECSAYRDRDYALIVADWDYRDGIPEPEDRTHLIYSDGRCEATDWAQTYVENLRMGLLEEALNHLQKSPVIVTADDLEKDLRNSGDICDGVPEEEEDYSD